MSTISINYSKAYAEANRLKTAANECDNLISQSQRAVAYLHTYWEGAAANEFLAANEKWRKEMQSIKIELTAISNSIKKVTDEIRAADLRAAEAAKKGEI